MTALLVVQITIATLVISVARIDKIGSSFWGSGPFRNQARPGSFLYLGAIRVF